MSSTNSKNKSVPESSSLKRKSNDVGWDYGILINPNNLDKVKCKLCGKEFSGGVYRMKEHIGRIPGNVAPCAKSTKEDQDKCKQALLERKNRKKNQMIDDAYMCNQVKLNGGEDETAGLGPNTTPRFLGPMDKFASPIDPKSSLRAGKTLQQQNINDALFKERLHSVHQLTARWMYESGIPFNAIDNDSFKLFFEAVGRFGPGCKPPSRYQLREAIKEEVERTKELMKEQVEE